MTTYSSTVTKVRTLAWFLRRPRLFPQLAHLASRKLTRAYYAKNNTREEAQRWCTARAIDSGTAIERLTGSRCAPLEGIFPDVFADAVTRARECPSSMGGPGDLDLLYAVAEHLEALRVVETGVAYGWSSMAILLSLKKRPRARLISTDMPIPCGNAEAYVGCVVPPDCRPQWSIRAGADRQVLRGSLREIGSLDMCHYDSDKSYEGRMWAYPLLWTALRDGGIFISDDIDDNLAFREFSQQVSAHPIVIRMRDEYVGEKFVGVLIKHRQR